MSSSAQPVTATEPALLLLAAGVSNDPVGPAVVPEATSLSVTVIVFGVVEVPGADSEMVPVAVVNPASAAELCTPTVNVPLPVPEPPVRTSQGDDEVTVAVHGRPVAPVI